MARFDFYPNRSEPGYLLDCQADLLSGLNTRLIVPLMPPEEAPISGARLNPSFTIEGRQYVMVTQYAASVPLAALGSPVGTLKDQGTAIINAWDMLLTGI